MNKYIPYLIIFAIGVLIGGGMCKTCTDHFRSDKEQSDTVYIHDTIRYSRLELTRNTCQLDVPKISMPEWVYIPADSVTIIYRDSVRYVTLPRQYYYTKVKDAEIWHSGIDSRIDSLNVVQKSTNITNTYKAKEKKNTLSLGLETSYCSTLSIPIYLEYERMLHKNVEFNASLFYDLPLRQYGVAVGINVQIGW